MKKIFILNTKKLLQLVLAVTLRKINSTAGHNPNLDVCDKCHPFYTGKQRDVATGGRVDLFNKRFKIQAANKIFVTTTFR